MAGVGEKELDLLVQHVDLVKREHRQLLGILATEGYSEEFEKVKALMLDSLDTFISEGYLPEEFKVLECEEIFYFGVKSHGFNVVSRITFKRDILPTLVIGVSALSLLIGAAWWVSYGGEKNLGALDEFGTFKTSTTNTGYSAKSSKASSTRKSSKSSTSKTSSSKTVSTVIHVEPSSSEATQTESITVIQQSSETMQSSSQPSRVSSSTSSSSSASVEQSTVEPSVPASSVSVSASSTVVNTPIPSQPAVDVPAVSQPAASQPITSQPVTAVSGASN